MTSPTPIPSPAAGEMARQPKWGDEVRLANDDPALPCDLAVGVGGNGDFYIGSVSHGARRLQSCDAVRITTSGQRTPGVVQAMGALYRALLGIAPPAPEPERGTMRDALEQVRVLCQDVVDNYPHSLKVAEKTGSHAGFGYGVGEKKLAKQVLALLPAAIAREVPR